MTVIVDTCVWSVALRHIRGPITAEARELEALVRQGRAAMLGIVRQELLSGIKSRAQFEALRDTLRDFPDVDVSMEDYELAASYFNRCRARGVQGSAIDFLICAVSHRRDFAIFTMDRDFVRYSKILGVSLHLPLSN